MQRNLEAVAMAPQDRRVEFRHDVQRPCRVTPATSPQVEMGAFTSNMSRSGILIRFPKPAFSLALPKIGEFARILIDLPANSKFTPRSLECSGRVVRSAGENSDDPELAFELLSMKIRARRRPRASRKRESTGVVQ